MLCTRYLILDSCVRRAPPGHWIPGRCSWRGEPTERHYNFTVYTMPQTQNVDFLFFLLFFLFLFGCTNFLSRTMVCIE